MITYFFKRKTTCNFFLVRCFIKRSHFLHSYLQKIAGIIRVRVFFEKMQYIFIFTKNWDTKIGWQSSHTKHSVFFNYCYINYDEYYMGAKTEIISLTFLWDTSPRLLIKMRILQVCYMRNRKRCYWVPNKFATCD